MSLQGQNIQVFLFLLQFCSYHPQCRPNRQIGKHWIWTFKTVYKLLWFARDVAECESLKTGHLFISSPFSYMVKYIIKVEVQDLVIHLNKLVSSSLRILQSSYYVNNLFVSSGTEKITTAIILSKMIPKAQIPSLT